MFGVTLPRQTINRQSSGPSRLPRAGKDWCFYSAGEKNFFIHSRYAGREHSRSFDLRFERFERGPDDFSSQTRIQFFGQARIAARMRNTYAFDDTIRAHLHRHWKHRAH